MHRKTSISLAILSSFLLLGAWGCDARSDAPAPPSGQRLAGEEGKMADPVTELASEKSEPEVASLEDEVTEEEEAPVKAPDESVREQAANSGVLSQLGAAGEGKDSLRDALADPAPAAAGDLGAFKGSTGVSYGTGGLGLSGVGRGGGGGISERGIGIAGLGTRGRGGAAYGKSSGKMKGVRTVEKSGKGFGARRLTRGPTPSDFDSARSSGSESYTNHGVNPMTETSKDRFSTFSIDVDTGAYTIARSKLKSNTMPPAASVRVEEFINYFSYNYGNPDSGAFGVNLEAAPSPFTADKERFVVRVGVQGKRIAAKDRKPVHLTFLVDTSGSMNRPNKLGLAKESLKILTRNLKPTDTVALTTYAGSTRVVLAPTSDRASILNALDNLTSGGGTAMGSGMELAYKQAMKSFKPGHVNRVIVLSDGDANIGRTSYDDMLKSIRSYVDEGVTMSTIGFGMGNYKDSLMEQLANKGNGNYYYIDDIKEARKVFGEQLDGTLEVIAKDVKIQVEFNPEVVKSYRLIGYENRDIADKDFRNDAVDAGEIGAGHSVTALYEVVMKPDHDGTLAYVRMRAKKPDGHKASEQIFMLSSADVAKSLADTSKDFQFATAVAGFAEILRGSEYAKALNYDLIIELAQAASSPSQKQRIEFIDLVQKAKRLDKRASLSMR